MSAEHPIAVLGAGSWGTALALLLARNGHRVSLWGHDPDHLAQLRHAGENQRYLPGIAFPARLAIAGALDRAVGAAPLVVIAVPSHAYGETLAGLRPHLPSGVGTVCASKGLEQGSGQFLHDVTARILGAGRPTAVLAGPSFAREVALGLPTAVTVASANATFAERVAGMVHGSNVRAYRSDDVIGVELGGAVKNVLAIAVGVADGLGFGANARAALITRGLAEMVRLGEALGGRRETFMGLAGVGDLVLTCTDDQSRNRRFGLALGQGLSSTQALERIGQVVEGADAVGEIKRLATRHGVDMPISDQVYRLLHEGQAPRRAVEELLARDPKPERG